MCFKNVFPQLKFLLRLIQFPFPFLTHKYELHAVVFKVELDRYVGHLSVSFQINSQTLFCSLFVSGANPCKLFPRLPCPCPLESSQVQPVKGPGEKLQVGRRKRLGSFFIGSSASDGHSCPWLCLFQGPISNRKPFPSVVPAPTNCPTVNPASARTLAPGSCNTASSFLLFSTWW